MRRFLNAVYAFFMGRLIEQKDRDEFDRAVWPPRYAGDVTDMGQAERDQNLLMSDTFGVPE